MRGSPEEDSVTISLVGSIPAGAGEPCIRHRQFSNWRWHLDKVFVKVGWWENNWAENSHLVFRRTERGMNKFRSDKSFQKFTAIHDQLFNHFNGDRHLTKRHHFKAFRSDQLAA